MNSKKVIILSGVSGSGKSTYADSLRARDADRLSIAVSADHFFLRNGVYAFDASKLSEAHGQCFKRFIDALVMKFDTIYVDNTNTTAVEIAPYVLGAQAYGCEVEIHTLTPPKTLPASEYISQCAARNKHGVSLEATGRQFDNIVGRSLPPWWVEKLITSR